MKKSILITSICLILANCTTQIKRIELDSKCVEYFIKTKIQNTEFKNIECAKILNKGDFLFRYNKNETIVFSTIDSGKLDGKMFWIKDGDTLSNSTYSNGKLIDKIDFVNGKIDKTEHLENNIYNIKYPNFEKKWILLGDILFKSKSISLKRNLENELLELNYIDSLGNNRLTINYLSKTSFLYNPKGKVIMETDNYIIQPEFRVEGGTLIISPNGLNLKPYPRESKTIEYKKIRYDDNGNLIQKDIFNVDNIYGNDIITSYFNTGKIRKKEVIYSSDKIKTKTYDLNNNLIKKTIKVIKIVEDTPEVIPDDDDSPEDIIMQIKD